MVQKYKAIICDYDGTLVGKDLVVSDQVKTAIKSLEKADIKFVIASGRAFNGPIEQLCKELGLTAPQIARGGAEIIDPSSTEIKISENIPDSDLSKLISILNKHEIDFWIEKGDYIFTKEGKPIAAFGQVPFKRLDELETTNVPKVGIFPISDEEKADLIDSELTDQFTSLHITRAFGALGKNWDITAALANKQEAILRVSKLLKIERPEIVGIGDGYNDFPLLEACGYKVVMGNGNQELKEIADEVVPALEEDGVAVFINKLLGEG